MKKLFTLFLVLFSTYSLLAQDSTKTVKNPAPTTKKKRDWSNINLSNRPNDHFMLQLGYNGWTNKTDSIHTKGFSRSFNIYFMYDIPFKSSPRFSVGIGAGVGSDNVFLDKTIIDITGRTKNYLTFQNAADTNHFKKYKLVTGYLEIPVELRFSANPISPMHSWKAAIGAKIGTMVSAAAKGKTLQNSAGTTINSYTSKEKSKRYFNGTRLQVTGRISYGILGIYGSYQINSFVKEGFGPDVRPFQIGITLSGL